MVQELIDKNKVLGIVAKKVSQARLETFKGYNTKLSFYWIDDEENIRGYGVTELDCVEQAKAQECEEYEILPLV